MNGSNIWTIQDRIHTCMVNYKCDSQICMTDKGQGHCEIEHEHTLDQSHGEMYIVWSRSAFIKVTVKFDTNEHAFTRSHSGV